MRKLCVLWALVSLLGCGARDVESISSDPDENARLSSAEVSAYLNQFSDLVLAESVAHGGIRSESIEIEVLRSHRGEMIRQIREKCTIGNGDERKGVREVRRRNLEGPNCPVAYSIVNDTNSSGTSNKLRRNGKLSLSYEVLEGPFQALNDVVAFEVSGDFLRTQLGLNRELRSRQELRGDLKGKFRSKRHGEIPFRRSVIARLMSEESAEGEIVATGQVVLRTFFRLPDMKTAQIRISYLRGIRGGTVVYADINGQQLSAERMLEILGPVPSSLEELLDSF